MDKLKKALGRFATDLALIGGAAAIAVGVGMYSFPAGLIVAGILSIAGVVLSALDGGDGD